MSLLDPGQIIKDVHDQTNHALQVNIVASAVSASTSTAINDGAVSSQKATVSVTGALKVDGSAVTQPISAVSLPLPSGAATESTLSTLNGKVTAVNTGAVVISSSALPTGAATETTLSAINTKTPSLGQGLMAASVPVVLASNQSAIPVSQSGTWNITNISGTVSLPTGASTETTLSAASAKLPATLGQKAMAASMAVVLASDQTAIPVTQSGTWNITNISGTVSLPTGAATETTLSAMSAKLPSSLGIKTAANSLSIAPASDASFAVTLAVNTSATGTLSNVAASATSVSLLASTAGRKGMYIYNDSTAILYLKFGTTASATSFTVKIQPDGFYEMPTRPVYTGAIDGIWTAANGSARITEMS